MGESEEERGFRREEGEGDGRTHNITFWSKSSRKVPAGSHSIQRKLERPICALPLWCLSTDLNL